MLTKVVEKQSPGSLSQHLGDMMPGLLKAYDNVESSVRKAAVFCIVALHQLVGEATLQVRNSSTIYEVVRLKVNHVLRSEHF
jgi:CLIP-associating protein 1/2